MDNLFNKLLSLTSASVVSFCIASCATDNYPKAKSLPSIDNQTTINTIWSNSSIGKLNYPGKIIPVVYHDLIYTASSNGKIYKISIQDGTTLEEYVADTNIASGIAVNDTDIIYTTNLGTLVARSKNNNTVSWVANLPTISDQAPQLINSSVIVKTIDGQTWAYDVDTGALSWGTPNQLFPLSLKSVNSLQVIPNANVIINGQPNGRVSLLNSTTGVAIWDSYISLPKGSSDISKIDDVAIRPIFEGKYIYIANYNGKLVSIDGASGHEVWSKEFSTSQGIVKDKSNLYAVNQDGVLFAFDAISGIQLWKNNLLEYRRVSAPLFYDNRIILIEDDGTMHLFSATDGAEISRKNSDLKSGISYPLYIKDGVIVQSANGNIEYLRRK